MGLVPGDGVVYPNPTSGWARESCRPGQATRPVAVRDLGLQEASGQRHGHLSTIWHGCGRPAWLSGPGLGTRWHTTVWCHPSALLTDADESGTVGWPAAEGGGAEGAEVGHDAG